MDESECLDLLCSDMSDCIERAWGAQIERGFLWQAAKEAAASTDTTRLKAWGEALDAAHRIVANVFGADQVGLARSLLWCAEQAATTPELSRPQTDSEVEELRLIGAPNFVNRDVAWSLLCIRTLLGHPSRLVKVPVAGWDEQRGEDGGFIATFLLEVLEGGAGRVAQHPVDSFVQFDGEFRDSIKNAWTAALREAGKDGEDLRHCDGRWRLQRDGHSIPSVSGRSASGAAARGWWYALTSKMPDEGVIVIARANDDGQMDGVEDGRGVFVKVKAIAAKPDVRFDTVVVASESNKKKAELGASDSKVRVVSRLQLEQLVRVRSQLAEQLEHYLETLSKAIRAKTEALGPGSERLANEIREELDRLRARTTAAEQFPVFVLVELARLGAQPQMDPADAIMNCLDEQFRLPELLRRWIKDALPTGRCHLIISKGEGKVKELERLKLTELLETIGTQGWNVTGSRILNVSDEWPDGDTLNPLQARCLVRAWFAPFIVARKRNPDFSGRGIVLSELRDALTRAGAVAVTQQGASSVPMGSRRQALAGLGGIGKTAVAVEYANRFRCEYDAVFFVRADQAENLGGDYEVICEELGLEPREYISEESGQSARQPQPRKDRNPAVRAVLHWLDTHSDWLLIVDNVEDPRMVSSFLPGLDRGHILVTSRRQHFAELGIRDSEPFVLDKLSRQEAEDMLWKRRGTDRAVAHSDELDAVKELVRLLDGLPLALEQAAALMRWNNYTFVEFLGLWRERSSDLFHYEEALDAGHPESVVTTIALAFEKIQQLAEQSPRHRPAPELLHLMAFLSPDDIPFELLIKAAPEVDADLPSRLNSISQETLVKEWLSLPKTYSLIEVDAEKRLCRMHRLVQEVLRSAMKIEDREAWAKRTIRALNRFCPILGIHYGNWIDALPVLSHAYAVASILQDPFRLDDFNFEKAADLLTKTGLLLTSLGRPEQAKPLLKRAEEIRGSDRSLKMAETLCFRADALEDSDEHEEARELYHRALEIRRQILGERSTDVGQIYNNLGVSHFNAWENEGAETYYQKAIKIWEKCGDSVLVGSALHNLAMLHQRQDKSDTESLFRKAAAKLETKHPHDNMVATVWHHLGDHLANKGEHAEGDSYMEQAQTLWEGLLGKNSAKLPRVLEDRADALEALGRGPQAAELRKRARKIRKQNE